MNLCRTLFYSMAIAIVFTTGFTGTIFAVKPAQQVAVIDTNYSEADYQRALSGDKNMQNAKLDGAVFKDKVLVDVNFSGASLKKSKFNDVTLTESNFEGAQLDGSTFEDADLTLIKANAKTSFQGCTFDGTKFNDATLNKVNFEYSVCKLSDSSFIGAHLNGAKFTKANLSFADFSNAEIKNANFSEAIVTHAVFDNADASNSIFNGAQLNSTTFIETNLNNIKCDAKTIFIDNDFSNATLDEAVLNNVRFLPGCNFTKTTFIKAQLNKGFFYNSTFSKTNFSNAQLNNSIFHKSTGNNVQLKGIGTPLTILNMRIDECTFDNWEIDKVNFHDTTLQNGSFTESKFYNVTFSKSILTKLDMSKTLADHLSFYKSLLVDVQFCDSALKDFELKDPREDVSIAKLNFDYATFIQGTIQGYNEDHALHHCSFNGTHFFGTHINHVRFTLCSAFNTIVTATGCELDDVEFFSGRDRKILDYRENNYWKSKGAVVNGEFASEYKTQWKQYQSDLNLGKTFFSTATGATASCLVRKFFGIPV